jgi:hypothetical protein
MPIDQSGYSDENIIFGGFGNVKLSVGFSKTCRLEPICTDAIADGYSYISLGGFRIGTSTYGQGRALWVYRPANMTLDDVYVTIWKGVEFEVAADTNHKSFCSYNIVYNSEIPNSNNMIRLGGGSISLDVSGKILCVDKGFPEDEKEAIIGSRLITLGRFDNMWAISLYSVFPQSSSSSSGHDSDPPNLDPEDPPSKEG